jgi:uncharacterized protein (TIGR03437 family)
MKLGRAVGLVLIGAGIAAAQQPTVCSDNCVLNAASYVKSPNAGFAVAPGSFVSIFGSNFATAPAAASSVPLSTQLGQISVTFNGTAAPLHSVSVMPFQQINAQVPWGVDVSSGTAMVVVTRNGVASPAQAAPVSKFSPGIFTTASSGVGMAVVQNSSDSTLAQPAGAIHGATTHPAKRGSVVTIYANGLGPVNPPLEDGHAGSDGKLHKNTTTPTILFGGVAAPVDGAFFSGASPQFPGVTQINVTVPNNAPTVSSVSLQIQTGGLKTNSAITMAIE